MIAYAFTSVAGKCKVGSYTGTGASGNTVDCGFEPSWVMVKRTDSTGNWVIFDNKRNSTNPSGVPLRANTSDAEVTTWNNDYMLFNTTGFEARGDASDVNASGGTYIYLAIVKEETSTINQYDITYADVGFTPTAIETDVPTSELPLTSTNTYDGTEFTKTSTTTSKQGRELQYQVVGDTDVEVSQVNVNLNKEY
jgi:hypothetical protein